MPRGGFEGNVPGAAPFSTGPANPGGSGHELMGEVAAYVAPCDLEIGQRVVAMTAGWAYGLARKEFESRTGVSAKVLIPVMTGVSAGWAYSPAWKEFESRTSVCAKVLIRVMSHRWIHRVFRVYTGRRGPGAGCCAAPRLQSDVVRRSTAFWDDNQGRVSIRCGTSAAHVSQSAAWAVHGQQW